MYKKRLAAGYPEEEILRSIYAKGRDNARTPMQWNGQENAGFTTGTPWLPVNPNYTSINVEAALADPDSVFWYYKKLIALRKEYPVFVEGDFTLLEEEHPQLFVYRRSTKNEQILVVCNFSGTDVSWSLPGEWTTAEMLISNYPDQVQKTLRPWEATILHRAL